MVLRFLIAALLAASAFAQSEFDVASVKPNRLDDRIVTIHIGPGGRFAVRGYTLKLLIQQAYSVMGWQIAGGPPWADSDRYDITATVRMPGDLTRERLSPMLERLLADRFQLRIHRDSKEMAGFALEIGRGGAKLKPASDGVPRPDTIRMSGIGFRGQGLTIADLVQIIGGTLSRPVADKTALKGLYDVELHWTEQTDRNSYGLPNPESTDLDGSNLFTALRDQLGLKLTAQKIAVPMIVIDRAEKASSN